jgi:hypothetical protein
MGLAKKYDYAPMQEDHKSGMTAKDIAAKRNCHISTVYTAIRALSGPKKNGRDSKIDWQAAQTRRNAGEKATDIITDMGISSAAFYTKTHPAGGKPPVIRSRRLLKPTPSPFEAKTFTTAKPAKNGQHRLVDEIKANLKGLLDVTVKERNEVVVQLGVLDKLIATLEKATK